MVNGAADGKTRLFAALSRLDYAVSSANSAALPTEQSLARIERRIDTALAIISPFLTDHPPKKADSDG